MSLTIDAQEHMDTIDWESMTVEEQSKVESWVQWINNYDRNTERTGVSVPSQCATDLGINLDGEL